MAAPTPAAPQTGYDMKGQATTTTGASTSTTQFSATANPTTTQNPALSFQQGHAAGAAQNDRRRVYRGCMARSGWLQASE